MDDEDGQCTLDMEEKHRNLVFGSDFSNSSSCDTSIQSLNPLNRGKWISDSEIKLLTNIL